MASVIVAAILAKTKKEFQRQLEHVSGIKNIQIDIIDGKFLKQKTVSVTSVPSFSRSFHAVEVHLMTKEPHRFISLLKKKGVKKVLFHYEA